MKLDANKEYLNNFESDDVEGRTAGPTERTKNLIFPTEHVFILDYSECIIRKYECNETDFPVSNILCSKQKFQRRTDHKIVRTKK
jgi:hypothetical protein